MTDAFEMMEDPGANADAEDVYNGILGEIGLEYSVGAGAVPTTNLAQPVAAQAEEVKAEEDGLEARLAALRMWALTWNYVWHRPTQIARASKPNARY